MSNIVKIKIGSKILEISLEELGRIVKSRKTFNKVLIFLNIRPSWVHSVELYVWCLLLNIPMDHISFMKNGLDLLKSKNYLDENHPIFNNKGNRKISKEIKAWYLLTIINNFVCSVCSQGIIWNNKPLTLQLDHINGDNKDHRYNNLRLLCPNCHTQTETFGAKNIKNFPKYNFCVDCSIRIYNQKSIRCMKCHLFKLNSPKRIKNLYPV